MSVIKNQLFDACEQLAEIAPPPIRDGVFDMLISCEHVKPEITDAGPMFEIDGTTHTLERAREKLQAAIEYGEWWLVCALEQKEAA